MRGRAITVPLNGAEFLELEAGCTKDGARSLPQYVRFRCELAAAVIANRPAVARNSSGRPVRLALERRAVTILVGDEEYAVLDSGATAAGLSIPQYIRTRCGFDVRYASNPHTDARDREEDDAWERLQRLGLEPEGYFED